jgi:hypothetical protein
MKLFVSGLNGNAQILRDRLKVIDQGEDLLSMREELGLLSSVMMDRTKSYASTLEADEKEGGNDKHRKVMLAGAILTEHANTLIAAKEKTVKAEAVRSESITRDAVLVWARQICDAAFRLFGETETTHAFVAEINGAILGTNTSRDINEEDIVKVMANTVPAIDVDSAFLEEKENEE